MAEKQRILIVDDDANIAELISLYLMKECYETMIVGDGEEALKVFPEFKPNLVLLDLMLPGIAGYQVCRELRASSHTETISDLEKVLAKAQESLPTGLNINIAQNANDFLFASIHEVIKTLIEAFILVFIVVYIFLQDMRSTLIPAIAIPVALVATFFVLKLIGFSVNLLTLSAMVLAIAIVVDDAIVVVEGVHAKLDQGYISLSLFPTHVAVCQ